MHVEQTITAGAQLRYPPTQGVNPWLVTVSVMLPTFMEVLDTASRCWRCLTFNMQRKIGGSIGIAMASTALIRRAAFCQTLVGTQVTASDPMWQQRSRALTMYLGRPVGPENGQGGMLCLVYGMLLRQAALRTYVDVFRWTALLAFFCAGAVGCSTSRRNRRRQRERIEIARSHLQHYSPNGAKRREPSSYSSMRPLRMS